MIELFFTGFLALAAVIGIFLIGVLVGSIIERMRR